MQSEDPYIIDFQCVDDSGTTSTDLLFFGSFGWIKSNLIRNNLVIGILAYLTQSCKWIQME